MSEKQKTNSLTQETLIPTLLTLLKENPQLKLELVRSLLTEDIIQELGLVQIALAAIIAGGSHPELATTIADILEVPILSPASVFPDGETRIKIERSGSFGEKPVVLFQSSFPNGQNDHIMELYFMAKACQKSQIGPFYVVLPYMPYARQDQRSSGEPVSLQAVFEMFTSAGAAGIIIGEPHPRERTHGFATIPVNTVDFGITLIKYLEETFKITKNADKFAIVAPDTSGGKVAEIYSNNLGLGGVFGTVNKTRDKETGITNSTNYTGAIVKGKTAIVIDDMIVRGGTTEDAINILLEQGANEIIIVTSHGLFLDDSLQRLTAIDAVKQIIVTDSIPQREDVKQNEKVTIVSVAQQLAEVINRVITKKTQSDLHLNGSH